LRAVDVSGGGVGRDQIRDQESSQVSRRISGRLRRIETNEPDWDGIGAARRRLLGRNPAVAPGWARGSYGRLNTAWSPTRRRRKSAGRAPPPSPGCRRPSRSCRPGGGRSGESGARSRSCGVPSAGSSRRRPRRRCPARPTAPCRSEARNSVTSDSPTAAGSLIPRPFRNC